MKMVHCGNCDREHWANCKGAWCWQCIKELEERRCAECDIPLGPDSCTKDPETHPCAPTWMRHKSMADKRTV